MSTLDRPIERASRNRGQGSGQRLDRYKVAYDESVRALDDQLAELDAMRQRAVQFLAFVGSATAFLVGMGVGATAPTSSRDGVFYAVATGATALSVLALGTILTLLVGVSLSRGKPRVVRWRFRLSAKILVGQWIDPEVGAKADEHFYRDLAIKYGEQLESNETALNEMRHRYWWFLLFGTLQVLAWAFLVWIFA